MRNKLIFAVIFIAGIMGIAIAQQPATQVDPIYAVNAKYTNGVAPGFWPTAGAGLTLNLAAGTSYCNNAVQTYAGGTLSMTNNTTNYVYLDQTSGPCNPASNTSGFTASTVPIAVVVTSAGAISTITDDRTFFKANSNNTSGVTTTGSPSSGNLTKFSGATSITNGDLSGDCTTSGTLAVTCTKINGGSVPTSAKYLQTNGSAQIVAADFPDVKIIPAANAPGGTAGGGWSYASGQFSATARAGSNNLGGALQAIPNTGAAAQFLVELPTDWDTSTQPYINIFYASGSNASGTVIWTVSSACVDVSTPGGTSDDPSFHAESAFSTQTMANANRMWFIGGQFTAMTSGNGCKATSPVIIKVALSGTAASNINVYQATLTIPRAPVVQAN